MQQCFKIYGNGVYTTPEILGEEQFNSKAYICSFGKIIYFIFTGEDPKSGDDFKFPYNFTSNLVKLK